MDNSFSLLAGPLEKSFYPRKFLLFRAFATFLFIFQVRVETCALMLKYLWFFVKRRLGHCETLRAVKLRRDSSVGIVARDV